MNVFDLRRVWMEKWNPELSEHHQKKFAENEYATEIVAGTRSKRWTISDAVIAVRKYKRLKAAHWYLTSKHPLKRNHPLIEKEYQLPKKRKNRRKKKAKLPPKPTRSAESLNSTESSPFTEIPQRRPKRKTQFENNDQYYSASQGHRPRGRPTPMSGETCNSCGSPITSAAKCNCS